jgi:hypothetical protein
MIDALMIQNVQWDCVTNLNALGTIFGQMRSGKCGNFGKGSTTVRIRRSDAKGFLLEQVVRILRNANEGPLAGTTSVSFLAPL